MAADDRAAQPSTIEHRRWWPLAAAATLLAVYFLLAVTGVAHKCATFDEVFHLTGGYSYWTISDFRMQPENGNLPQRWAALPLLFGDYKFPAVDSGDWRRSSVAAVGGRFVYGAGKRRRPHVAKRAGDDRARGSRARHAGVRLDVATAGTGPRHS